VAETEQSLLKLSSILNLLSICRQVMQDFVSVISICWQSISRIVITLRINISVNHRAERYFTCQIRSFHLKTRQMNFINIGGIEAKLNYHFYI